MLEKQEKRHRRHRKVRGKIRGTAKMPRFCVFRSNKHIYAQLIDDEKGKTLVLAKDLEIKKSKAKVSRDETSSTRTKHISKVEVAREVGMLIAKKAKDLKIEKVIFDRAGYKYHGRTKALAEGAKEGGLKF